MKISLSGKILTAVFAQVTDECANFLDRNRACVAEFLCSEIYCLNCKKKRISFRYRTEMVIISGVSDPMYHKLRFSIKNARRGNNNCALAEGENAEDPPSHQGMAKATAANSPNRAFANLSNQILPGTNKDKALATLTTSAVNGPQDQNISTSAENCQEPVAPFGLENNSSCCYANVVAQSLLSLIQFVTRDTAVFNLKNNPRPSAHYISARIEEIRRKLPRFNNEDHQDPHEFLILLLEKHQQLEKLFKVTLSGDVHFGVSISVKQFNSIDFTSRKSSFLRKIEENLPPILLFHFDRNINQKKNPEKVEFNHEILGGKYSLKSIVMHSGSVDYGHYTACCKRDFWYYFDDSIIQKEMRVFPGEISLLFYEKL